MNLTYEDKVALFRAHKYEMTTPPGPTVLWGESDWIKWIDNNGRWMYGG